MGDYVPASLGEINKELHRQQAILNDLGFLDQTDIGPAVDGNVAVSDADAPPLANCEPVVVKARARDRNVWRSDETAVTRCVNMPTNRAVGILWESKKFNFAKLYVFPDAPDMLRSLEGPSVVVAAMQAAFEHGLEHFAVEFLWEATKIGRDWSVYGPEGRVGVVLLPGITNPPFAVASPTTWYRPLVAAVTTNNNTPVTILELGAVHSSPPHVKQWLFDQIINPKTCRGLDVFAGNDGYALAHVDDDQFKVWLAVLGAPRDTMTTEYLVSGARLEELRDLDVVGVALAAPAVTNPKILHLDMLCANGPSGIGKHLFLAVARYAARRQWPQMELVVANRMLIPYYASLGMVQDPSKITRMVGNVVDIARRAGAHTMEIIIGRTTDVTNPLQTQALLKSEAEADAAKTRRKSSATAITNTEKLEAALDETGLFSDKFTEPTVTIFRNGKRLTLEESKLYPSGSEKATWDVSTGSETAAISGTATGRQRLKRRHASEGRSLFTVGTEVVVPAWKYAEVRLSWPLPPELTHQPGVIGKVVRAFVAHHHVVPFVAIILDVDPSLGAITAGAPLQLAMSLRPAFLPSSRTSWFKDAAGSCAKHYVIHEFIVDRLGAAEKLALFRRARDVSNCRGVDIPGMIASMKSLKAFVKKTRRVFIATDSTVEAPTIVDGAADLRVCGIALVSDELLFGGDLPELGNPGVDWFVDMLCSSGRVGKQILNHVVFQARTETHPPVRFVALDPADDLLADMYKAWGGWSELYYRGRNNKVGKFLAINVGDGKETMSKQSGGGRAGGAEMLAPEPSPPPVAEDAGDARFELPLLLSNAESSGHLNLTQEVIDLTADSPVLVFPGRTVSVPAATLSSAGSGVLSPRMHQRWGAIVNQDAWMDYLPNTWEKTRDKGAFIDVDVCEKEWWAYLFRSDHFPPLDKKCPLRVHLERFGENSLALGVTTLENVRETSLILNALQGDLEPLSYEIATVHLRELLVRLRRDGNLSRDAIIPALVVDLTLSDSDDDDDDEEEETLGGVVGVSSGAKRRWRRTSGYRSLIRLGGRGRSRS